jgi:hypothetical protein
MIGSAAALVAGRADAAMGKRKSLETYYFLVFNNPVPGREQEYLSWYDNRHIIDVMAIPGFVSGQRFIRNEPQMFSNVEPKLANYLTLYKVRTKDLDALTAEIKKRIQTGVTKLLTPTAIQGGTSSAYWYRFSTPEIKRTKPMPAAFSGKKLENYVHIVFMNAVDGMQSEWETWYDKVHSPEMLTGDGIMTSQRTTLALPAEYSNVPATKEMVLFTVQLPEGLPPSAAAPPRPGPRPANAPPSRQKDTRGYTYRQIGPLITHKEAVARKASFTE